LPKKFGWKKFQKKQSNPFFNMVHFSEKEYVGQTTWSIFIGQINRIVAINFSLFLVNGLKIRKNDGR
jgi:hypothetical protein